MGLVLKLAKKLGLVGKVLPALIKAVAEGKMGEGPKRAYWSVAGYKTLVGATLWVLASALEMYGQTGYCPDCSTWLPYVQRVAELLVVVGLADAAVREVPPAPPAEKVRG